MVVNPQTAALNSLRYPSIRTAHPLPQSGQQYFEIATTEWSYHGMHVGVVGLQADRFDTSIVRGRATLSNGPSWSLSFDSDLEHFTGSQLHITKLPVRAKLPLIGVLIDMDAGTMRLRVNGSWTGVVFKDLPPILYPAVTLAYKPGVLATISFPAIPN